MSYGSASVGGLIFHTLTHINPLLQWRLWSNERWTHNTHGNSVLRSWKQNKIKWILHKASAMWSFSNQILWDMRGTCTTVASSPFVNFIWWANRCQAVLLLAWLFFPLLCVNVECFFFFLEKLIFWKGHRCCDIKKCHQFNNRLGEGCWRFDWRWQAASWWWWCLVTGM